MGFCVPCAVRPLLACGALLLAAPVRAQEPVRNYRKYAVEVVTRDRWMNSRQRPLHTPTTTATTWIYVDSIAVDSAANARIYWAQTGVANTGDPAIITSTLDGRVHAINASLRPRQPSPAMLAAVDTARMTRARVLSSTGDRLTLPESRVWDLVRSFRPARLVAGSRWVDTIALSATFGDMHQSLRGVRTYVLVRDTVVAGRNLWIDSEMDALMLRRLKVSDAAVKTGDTLLFQGPSTNFDQKVESLEIDKVKVPEAKPGQSVGVQVRERVRPGDLVYKIVA